MPRWTSPADGKGAAWDLAVRPGEPARLEIELSGVMDAAVLTVNGQALQFPVALKPDEKLACNPQGHWIVTDRKRDTIAEGNLPAGPPFLSSGLNRVSFTCTTPDHALVTLVKVYAP